MHALTRAIVQRAASASSRQMSIVSGPPQNKISFPEKVAHGLAIVIGCSIIPTYVLVNIRNYRGEEPNN